VGRKLKATALLVGIIAFVMLGVAIWLTAISVWWWFLAGFVIAIVLLLVIVYTVAAVVVRLVRPGLTEKQQAGVTGFVDKLERVAENVATPLFIIVFRVAWDLFRRHQPNYIQTVADDSSTLHKGFAKPQKLFKD
jgi:membrane protein implicated in regulation of membrane protease activity